MPKGHPALDRTLSGLPKPGPVLRDPKPMPCGAARRHRYRSAAIRSLDHGRGGFRASSVTTLDHDSRAVLASGRSRPRDPGPFLLALVMAIQPHGAPEG